MGDVSCYTGHVVVLEGKVGSVLIHGVVYGFGCNSSKWYGLEPNDRKTLDI